MMRLGRLFPVMLAVAIPWGCGDFVDEAPLAPELPAAKVVDGPGIKVMSQNLYLGVDLGTLLSATTPEQVIAGFQQLVLSNALDAANPAYGPRRLRDIAYRIATEDPHLVGLQEVVTYHFEFADDTEQTLAFIEPLMAWLEAFRQMGVTAHQWTPLINDLVEAPPLTLPLASGDLTVTYFDADAILVRSDVDMLAPPVHGVFDAVQHFSVFGAVFPFYRGFTAVPVDVDGHELVFVNTHLEVQRFEPVQLEQTAELIAFMDEQTLPVVAVGDFNSAANHDAPEDQKTGSYQMFRSAGYADIWLREPHSVGGATCCQAGDLTNPDSQLGQRLDLVLVRWGPAGFGGRTEMEVVGEEPGDRILFTAYDPFSGSTFPLGLWESDHAGVVATLWPAPGR